MNQNKIDRNEKRDIHIAMKQRITFLENIVKLSNSASPVVSLPNDHMRHSRYWLPRLSIGGTKPVIHTVTTSEIK